jgi:hypothetical protein
MENFQDLKPRERVIYHTGLLARDVMGNPDLSRTRDYAWYAYISGKALLASRRKEGSEPVFEYFIIGRSL